MAGRTGYTATPPEYDPRTHIDDVYEHYDTLVGETVDEVADLPASGNWVGRTIWVADIEELRVWGGSAWKPPAASEDTDWIDATLQNSWVATVGLTPQYRRLNGVVFLRGRAVSGTTAAAFTLPAGFRPSMLVLVPIHNGTTPGTFTTVTVNTDGTVVPQSGAAPYFGGIPPFPADA